MNRLTRQMTLVIAAISGTVCCAADVSPTQLAVSPDGTQLCAVCRDASTVAVIPTRSEGTPAVLRWLTTSPYPTSIVVVDSGAMIIVASGLGKGVLEKIDVMSGEVITRITAGHSPIGLSLSPDGTRLFVCDRFASILDGIRRRITLPAQGASGVAVTGSKLWVSLTLRCSEFIELHPL